MLVLVDFSVVAEAAGAGAEVLESSAFAVNTAPDKIPATNAEANVFFINRFHIMLLY